MKGWAVMICGRHHLKARLGHIKEICPDNHALVELEVHAAYTMALDRVALQNVAAYWYVAVFLSLQGTGI